MTDSLLKLIKWVIHNSVISQPRHNALHLKVRGLELFIRLVISEFCRRTYVVVQASTIDALNPVHHMAWVKCLNRTDPFRQFQELFIVHIITNITPINRSWLQTSYKFECIRIFRVETDATYFEMTHQLLISNSKCQFLQMLLYDIDHSLDKILGLYVQYLILRGKFL